MNSRPDSVDLLTWSLLFLIFSKLTEGWWPVLFMVTGSFFLVGSLLRMKHLNKGIEIVVEHPNKEL